MAREFAPVEWMRCWRWSGGRALKACINQLRPGGRVAFPEGVQPEPQARPGLAIVKYNAVAGPQEYARLNQALIAAKLEVPIAAEFPLSDAAGAQRAMAAGHVLGKIVLRVH